MNVDEVPMLNPQWELNGCDVRKVQIFAGPDGLTNDANSSWLFVGRPH